MPNGVKTVLLLGALSGLLLVIGDVLGGANGLMLGLMMAAVMNIGSYWFSDKIVLRMYSAQAVGPEHPLYRITERLARQAGLPMPKVYVIPDPSPNAFATGRNPQHAAVAATQGILQVLNERELEGVIAHELAHIMNRDMLISTVAAGIAGAISNVPYLLMFGGGGGSDDEGGHPFAQLALILLAPIAAMLIQMAVSRQREFEADRVGAEIAGRPLSLANALTRLDNLAHRIPMNVAPAAAPLAQVNPLAATGGGMTKLFSTHPPTAERVARLQAMAAGR
jgi:heat shock protein HtpX